MELKTEIQFDEEKNRMQKKIFALQDKVFSRQEELLAAYEIIESLCRLHPETKIIATVETKRKT